MVSTGEARQSGGHPVPAQGVLFQGDLPELDEEAGYRGPTACKAAGITYRQLDYWARTGLVEPSVRPAGGSGTQRLYGFRDILVLKVVKRLLDTGVSLQQIRGAIQVLRARGVDDLAQITLMSDGASVYECTSNEEVIDLLQGGQGVFGIALGKVWREVEGELASPAQRAGRARGRRHARSRATSSVPVAPRAWPEPRPTGSPVVDWRPPLTPCGRDLDAVRRGAEGANLPGTSQAQRTTRDRHLWSTRRPPVT